MEGAVGVLSFLQSFVLGTFNSVNFSLTFYNKIFNEAVLEFWNLVGASSPKIGIPFYLFDQRLFAFKYTS